MSSTARCSISSGGIRSEAVDVSPVMYGRPLFGKGVYEVSAIGSGAVMYPACLRGFPTAGHEGIRGSGSYHSGALEAR